MKKKKKDSHSLQVSAKYAPAAVRRNLGLAVGMAQTRYLIGLMVLFLHDFLEIFSTKLPSILLWPQQKVPSFFISG